MSLSIDTTKLSWLPQTFAWQNHCWRSWTPPKFPTRYMPDGGPEEDRTPTWGLQSHCAPIITTSPKLLRTETNACNQMHWEPAMTLVSQNRGPMHLITLPFFYPHKDKPSGRPPVCSSLQCGAGPRFPWTPNEKPRVFSPGSRVRYGSMLLRTLSLLECYSSHQRRATRDLSGALQISAANRMCVSS